jgi:SAM-dependent methyltransferase
VREFFGTARFDDVTVCQLLGMKDMSDLGHVRWLSVQLEAVPTTLHLCIRAFLRGQSLPSTDFMEVCGPGILEALQALGLIRPSLTQAGRMVCPVWVYPAKGFVLASDRRDDPDGKAFIPAPDVVFPAIYGGTLRFLELLPDEGGDALDLCGGSGIGAMFLSRTSARAATADITKRSAWFAEFNARLNGSHIESLCGDLYTPVGGRTFDLITAHPPFVPASGDNMTYRDAGDTGEEITQRIVQGLPTYLRPGGTCVLLCVARDTTDGPFEERLQRWLAPCADQFDVIFGREKILSIEEVVDSVSRRGSGLRPEEADRLRERLRSLGTEQFVYGAVFVRRLFGSTRCKPLRLTLSPTGKARDFERVFDWRQQRAVPGFADWFSRSRPHLAPQLELRARYEVKEAELVPAEFVFSVNRGLEAALRLDGWVVPLVARLAGKATIEEVFENARSAAELPSDFTLQAFGELVGDLVERGFLDLDLPS